jgi:predicted naringenin-chalcone synthase
MHLSGETPGALRRGLPAALAAISPEGRDGIDHWAIHPGGKSILDAVEAALDLEAEDLWASREVLRRYGNMSSPSVLFVLARMMNEGPVEEGAGVAMAFGPGLTAETMRFTAAG